MSDFEKRKSRNTRNLDSKNLFRHAARFGIFALALGALVIVGVLGSAPRAGAGNADDSVGATAFKSNCVVCHGADGTGTPTGKALKAPDLHSDVVQKMTKLQIEDQISNGKNNMPPFKNTLSKDQISALADYVHSEFGKKK
ncbi:MAG TPA: cytochrome c [Candidatus Acidoferrales bacterium]|nr:cytochrome c [Candidatus Acidoferrales bacterium]